MLYGITSYLFKKLLNSWNLGGWAWVVDVVDVGFCGIACPLYKSSSWLASNSGKHDDK